MMPDDVDEFLLRYLGGVPRFEFESVALCQLLKAATVGIFLPLFCEFVEPGAADSFHFGQYFFDRDVPLEFFAGFEGFTAFASESVIGSDPKPPYLTNSKTLLYT